MYMSRIIVLTCGRGGCFFDKFYNSVGATSKKYHVIPELFITEQGANQGGHQLHHALEPEWKEKNSVIFNYIYIIYKGILYTRASTGQYDNISDQYLFHCLHELHPDL